MSDDHSKKRVRMIAGGCLVLVLVVCCLCVGGGGGVTMTKAASIRGTIDDFMTAAGNQDIEAAYALMAPEYRQQYELSRFRRELGECRSLVVYASYEIETSYGQRRLDVAVRNNRGETRAAFWVRDADGEDRIRSISVYSGRRQVCRISPRVGTPF